MSQTESTRTWEVENVAVQASVREDVEGELVEARQGQEVAEEKFRTLSLPRLPAILSMTRGSNSGSLYC
jgi:hypothetical protein